MFDLSLDELLSFDLSGTNVKSMQLTSAPLTNNPFELENLKLPRSIEVVRTETINARAIKNVVEVLSNMTGVLSGESPSEPYSFGARGFTRDSVNVVYDGISMGLATFNTRPITTFNVAQVEFSKGPTEFSVGQNGAGGTINIISKKAKPSNHHKREALLIAGEYDTYSLNVGFSGPIAEGWAYRVDLSRNSSEGWVRDSDSHSNNVSASALWHYNADAEVLFSFVQLHDELPAYWGTPFVSEDVAREPNHDVVDSGNLVIDEATRFTNYNISDHEISSDSQWRRIDVNWAISDNAKLNATLYQFDAERYWQNAESYFYNPALALVERDRLLVKHDRNNWGAVVGYHLRHKIGDLPSKTSLQMDFHDIDFHRDVGFNLANPTLFSDAVDLYQPQSGVFGDVDLRADSLDQRTSSVMLSNITELTPKLTLHAQFEFEHVAFDRLYINWDGSLRERATLDSSRNEHNSFLGINYLVSPQLSVYAHIANSHDPLFTHFRTVWDISNLNFSDVEQYEAGLKGSFDDKKTEFSLALFDIEKNVDTQVDSESTIFESETHSQGIEASLNTQIFERLRLAAQVSYVDAKFGTFYDPETGVFATGNEPINVPDVMVNLRGSYELESLPLELGLSLQSVSSRWADSSNTVELKPYKLFNMYAAYQGENYYLALHLKNLTDELFGPWSDIYYPNQLLLGAPRRLELVYKVNF